MFKSENGFGSDNNGGKAMSDFADKIFAAAGVDKKQAEAEKKELRAKKRKDDRWNTIRLVEWLKNEHGKTIWWDRISNKGAMSNLDFSHSIKLDDARIAAESMWIAEATGLTDNIVEDFLRRACKAALYNNVRNPVRETLLEGLTLEQLADKYANKTDYIEHYLERIIRIKDDFDRRLWLCFHTAHLLQVVDNESMKRRMPGALVLIGETGQGKSTLVQWYCSPFAQYYVNMDRCSPDNKDHIDKLHSTFLTELEEPRDCFSKTSIDFWKSDITSSFDEDRKTWGRDAARIPRHTGYVLTSNDRDILFDRTSTRRFLVPSGLGGGYDKRLFDPSILDQTDPTCQYPVDWVLELHRQLLGLAVREEKNGITWLNREEQDEQAKRNRANEYTPTLESVIRSLFEWENDYEEVVYRKDPLRPIELVQELADMASQSRIVATTLQKGYEPNVTKIGNALTKMARDGLIVDKGRKGYLFPVYRKSIRLECEKAAEYNNHTLLNGGLPTAERYERMAREQRAENLRKPTHNFWEDNVEEEVW